MPLTELTITNLAVLRRARVAFSPSFTVITGETGAGKSVLLQSLRLALGGKASPEMVRKGATESRVAATFTNPAATTQTLLESLGCSQEEMITLTREISTTGQSRYRVNGDPISQTKLHKLGQSLAELTAQGEATRLLQETYQRHLLDDFGGPLQEGLLRAAGEAVKEWKQAKARLAKALESNQASQTARANAEMTVETLRPLDFHVGEDEELTEAIHTLSIAVDLQVAASRIAEALTRDEVGASDTLFAALQETRLLATDRGFTPLYQEATEIATRLQQLSRDFLTRRDEIESDPAKLQEMEARLGTLHRIARRYGSLENAKEALDGATALLDDLDQTSALPALVVVAEELEAKALSAVEELSTNRRALVAPLVGRIQGMLRNLGMPKAEVEMDLETEDSSAGLLCGSRRLALIDEGVERVRILLAPNGGSPIPLDRGISGGELSRLALVLRVISGEPGPPSCPASQVGDSEHQTLVLDEIDTGIGGDTAARIGSLLKDLGQSTQVICITHRAEIAACAAHHLLVEKEGDTSRVRTVEGMDRQMEMARLLSGSPTPAALLRAEELLHREGNLVTQG